MFPFDCTKSFVYLRNDRENTDWPTESLLNTGFTSTDFNCSGKIDAKIMSLKLAKKKKSEKNVILSILG